MSTTDTSLAGATATGTTATTDDTKAGSTVITVDGTEYTKTESKTYSASDEDASGLPIGTGWDASTGTLTISSETIKELTVKEGDLTLQAAGLNHINKLVSDSVVNIIGTGILLLDDYDLKDSGEVTLTKTSTYEDQGVVGSVAVFLKDKEASSGSESTYKLINGSVPGILDQQYTLPSGVNLVMPSGTKIFMNSVSETVDGTEQNNSSALTIASGSSLTVEKGATIEMVAVESKSAKESGDDEYILTPTITVADGGTLTMKGTLKGNGGSVTTPEEELYLGKKSGLKTEYQKPGDDSSEEEITAVMLNNILDKVKEELHQQGKTDDDTVTYEDIKKAADKVNPEYPTPANAVFFIKNGSTVTYIEPGDSVKLSDLNGGLPGEPYTGQGLTSSNSGVSGLGRLEDGLFPATGSPTTILKATAAEVNPWRVIVTENPRRGTWTLSVWYGDTQIFDLGTTTVRARFDFDLPDDWDGQHIYVVFLDKQNNLRAIPAVYNPVTGELVFDSNLVGEFVVVRFEYQGELYSKDFYNELARLEQVKHLVELLTGK